MAFRSNGSAGYTQSACRKTTRVWLALALFLALLGLVGPVDAFEPNPLLQSIADNTAKDLGPYTCTDAPGEWAGKCRTVHDFSGMQYDANRHQMVIFGGGHSSTNYNAINTFSLDTLSWKEEYLPTPCSDMRPDNFDWSKGAWVRGSVPGPYPIPAARHTEDLMNMAGDELILVTSVEGDGGPGCLQWPTTWGSYEIRSQNQVAHYSFRTKTWRFGSANAQTYNWPASEYDPVSNKIVMFGLDGMSLYDPVTTVRTVYMDFINGSYPATDERGNPLNYNVIDQTPRYNNTLVYYPPTDKFYYFEKFAGTIFEITLNRASPAASRIVKIAYTGAYPVNASIGWAYDSTNQVIGGGPVNNVFYAFDPRTKSMQHKTIQGAYTGNGSFQTIGYDPVNNVYIFVTGEASTKETWAYRWAGGAGASRNPPASGPAAAPLSAAVSLTQNATTYGPGDTVRVGVNVNNPGTAFDANFYLGVIHPDGVTISFVTALQPVAWAGSRLDADPQTYPALINRVAIPQGLNVQLDNYFVHTLSTEQPGTYTFFAFLAPPTVFATGMVDAGQFYAIDMKQITIARPSR
jgi:hypothetical protein